MPPECRVAVDGFAVGGTAVGGRVVSRRGVSNPATDGATERSPYHYRLSVVLGRPLPSISTLHDPAAHDRLGAVEILTRHRRRGAGWLGAKTPSTSQTRPQSIGSHRTYAKRIRTETAIRRLSLASRKVPDGLARSIRAPCRPHVQWHDMLHGTLSCGRSLPPGIAP